ncbi:N-acetylmuramoyl-L-alanine amidase [Aneurinibacillus tyrosinisolvens]|uniref:N-acetylmuramoyl-L-alanine amidase n=1 Tax=Aneurinibacillus tyrosinisolvens TaxID=1443435 RepID=UPI0006993E48|nr:N-acetylmuramoyl-L-alanine amidase [Aneurinibacillus tyrosinisolvens]
MRKILCYMGIFLFLLAGVFSAPGQVNAASTVYLWVNGKEVKSDVPPQVVNGRTLVPVYVLKQGMNMDVNWNAKEQRVTIKSGGKNVELTINSPIAKVNGVKKNLGVSPSVTKGRTFLPFRALGELLGAAVGWEGDTRSVILNRPVNVKVEGKATSSGVYQISGDYFVALKEIASAAGYQVNQKNGSISLQKGSDVRPLQKGYRVINGEVAVPLSSFPSLIGGTGSWNSNKTEFAMGKVSQPPVVPPAKPAVPPVKIVGIEKTETGLQVKSDGKVSVKHFTLPNPDRVVLDFQNAELASNNLPITSREASTSVIKAIRYSQTPETGTVRVAIELTDKPKYDIVSTEYGTQVKLTAPKPVETPAPQPPVIENPSPEGSSNGQAGPVPIPPVQPAVPLSGKEQVVIVVDAGHGGTDSGAVGNGAKEKNITLGISQKLADALNGDSKFKVIMTRESDTYPTLTDRVNIANNNKADLFISVHINSVDNNPKPGGTETYYYAERSKTYAATVHRHLSQATGFMDRKVKTAGFQVIKYTKMPAILVEIGFISNPEETAKMTDESFQQGVADSLYEGIKEYVNNN